MSISNPKIQNPCKKFIEFKGGEGVFQYWDKKEKKNLKVPYPVRFIVLDELSTIKGWCDATESGIYSNEVHNLNEEKLNVRTFKGKVSTSGIYQDIKGHIKTMGGKFCKSVYALLIPKQGEVELVNFQMSGASLNWIEKDIKVSESIISVSKVKEGKKGKIVYKMPVWEAEPMEDVLKDKAIEMDRMLQSFLSIKKTKDSEEIPSSQNEGPDNQSPESKEDEDDIQY